MKCEDCKFWDDTDVPKEFRLLPENEGELMYGECRRYAPTFSMREKDREVCWPQTEAELGWCGEFKEKVNEVRGL
jgi:hypothetical protein